MKLRALLIALALTTTATDSEAGPLRRRAQPACQYPSYSQPSVTYPSYAQPVVPAGEYTTSLTPNQIVLASGDGLDEVNAKRAARGLRPFIRDDGLTQAAQACAAFRAQHGLFGHSSNDFSFVPPGSSAASAGCAAYPASYGWMSCCTWEPWTYAGAAWVTGTDGRRYMHLFVR